MSTVPPLGTSDLFAKPLLVSAAIGYGATLLSHSPQLKKQTELALEQQQIWEEKA